MMNKVEIFVSKVAVPTRIHPGIWTQHSLRISTWFRFSHVATWST